MLYGLSLATAATTEPVTLAEAKKQVELAPSFSDHDEHLTTLISAARDCVERETNRAIITQTWDLFLDCFPEGNGPIMVPKAPLQSVTWLKYYDANGTQQTWTSTNYLVSVSREPGRIQPACSVIYPAIQYRADAVNVRFVAGYGAASSVPGLVKSAILLLVAHWFEHREEVNIGNVVNEVPRAAASIMEQLRYGDEFVNYSGVY